MINEANSMTYRGSAIADILRLAGLNKDLSCDTSDPRNAIYCVALCEPDEGLAELMASAIFGAIRNEHADDPTFNPDVAFEQCLVDARRMILDPNYALLFGGTDWPPPEGSRPIER